ncbi:MAG: molybdopterin molybdenumtransferase MoeA, partial [Actinobacteria bacterium]|nr:molybdopterin molybdenumtransferase MoeA [Actinomycetota bacterium]
MADLVLLDDAIHAVLAAAEPLPAEDVALDEARGRVLAAAARATTDLPPFDSSAMDGFAIRSTDAPGRLAIAGRVAAGRPESRRIAAGEAFEISTGGVVPAGADAVVPIERVHLDTDTVAIPEGVTSGDNIRARGRDVSAG